MAIVGIENFLPW